jgi:nitrate reductase alpha subunit
MRPGSGIDRRTFLRATAAGTATVALGLWRLSPAAGSTAAAALPLTHYGDFRDIYRQRWAWDRVVRSSHWVNCWYQAHCAWDVYVKDGVVWREEQAADYPQIRPDVPDFNPRGCQKGACFSERMYDPARIRHPLKRAGPRGSGKWKRISWEQALDEIADSMVETIDQEGTDRIIWDDGPGISLGAQTAGAGRLRALMDSTTLDMNTEIGDGHRGAAETFGKIVFERSADDYFFSDLIVCWGSNPYYTQIPNAHFLTEARYHGAQIVCISPDFNASSIHADLWVPVKPGTDAALGTDRHALPGAGGYPSIPQDLGSAQERRRRGTLRARRESGHRARGPSHARARRTEAEPGRPLRSDAARRDEGAGRDRLHAAP